MSATRELEPSLERLLASVLYYGTWLASVVIAVGLAGALLGGRPAAMRIVTAGILLLILLPVSRVTLMLIVFVRERDYRFGAIAALVLAFIVIGFVVGARSQGGVGHSVVPPVSFRLTTPSRLITTGGHQ